VDAQVDVLIGQDFILDFDTPPLPHHLEFLVALVVQSADPERAELVDCFLVVLLLFKLTLDVFCLIRVDGNILLFMQT